jgi:hypothetical protein
MLLQQRVVLDILTVFGLCVIVADKERRLGTNSKLFNVIQGGSNVTGTICV